MSCRFRYLFGTVASAVCIAASPVAIAAEWEESSPYYEDDAWYDVTEWLDGNDYNPTDEQFGEWDNEVYDSDSLEYDYDDDDRFGYNSDDQPDNWFYDYWEPNYWTYDGDRSDADSYDYAYSYYDYDGDGIFDSYTSYYDWNDDGWFEDVDHYTFDSWTDETRTASTDRQSQNQQSPGNQSAQASRQSSKRHKISGQVTNKKNVAVRGVTHVVVQVKQQDGKHIAADLGPQSGLKNVNVAKDSQITAQGLLTKAGDKPVLLARSITIDGSSHQLDRQPRKFEGTVVSTRQIPVRGQQHTLVVMKTEAGKQRLVDLGRSDRLQELDLRKNAQISVRGVPLKVNDRPLVMAHSVESDGTSVSIDRRPDRQS
jgi:hypothetical protein